jgi:hypothetical protein
MSKFLTSVAIGAGSLLGIVTVVAAFGLIFSYFVMLLWNGCLVPAVNGVNEIGVLQAWGLSIMFALLMPRVSHSSK